MSDYIQLRLLERESSENFTADGIPSLTILAVLRVAVKGLALLKSTRKILMASSLELLLWPSTI